NVGKAKRVSMPELRETFASLGYSDVRTLLNSGNVVFDAANEPAQAHANRIRRAIAEQLAIDCNVVVKDAKAFARAVADNPMHSASKASRQLVLFTQDDSSLRVLNSLTKTDWVPESLAIGKSAAYLWCPDGIHLSRLAKAVSDALGERATT